MEKFNGKIMFGWITGLFLFLWMGYFFGYFVATDKAMESLKEREAKWKEEAQTHKDALSKKREEAKKAESAATGSHNEMIGLRKKVEDLTRELERVKLSGLTERNLLVKKIGEIEEVLTMKSAELREAHQVLSQRKLISTDHFDLQSPLTLKQIVTAKNAFHDIQHEIAAGNFKGLDLTNGYQRLKTIFENPDMEDLVRLYDTAKGDER